MIRKTVLADASTNGRGQKANRRVRMLWDD